MVINLMFGEKPNAICSRCDAKLDYLAITMD